MLNNKTKRLWRITTIFGVILYIVISISFILLGRVNADEGWYLYASRLVYEGQYPYQDFAYTQTPLLPYVYGLAQSLFSSSIYLGRITTLSLSIIALFLSLSTARKYAGEMASAITSLLWATFTYGIYFQSITKTYALTTFFFTLVFFVLSTQSIPKWKPILATVFALLATLTRLSALFFAIPIILYAFVIASKKGKFIIIVLCCIATSWVLLLALPNMEAAQWNLLTHHTSQWESRSIIEQAVTIVTYRLPALLLTFASYSLLLFVMIVIGVKKIISYLNQNLAVFVMLMSLLFFVLPNLITGGFHTEYFVPFFFGLFTIIGILYVKIYQEQQNYSKIILQVVLLSALILGLLSGGFAYADTSGRYLPVEEIKEVSSLVVENSSAEDKIYVLEALWIVVEADRHAMPNTTMAQFSFYDGDTNEAEMLHLVNDQMTLEYIVSGIPKLILLTDLDWKILQKTENYTHIIIALEEQYELQLEEGDFGQRSGNIQVYLRREDN